MKNVFGVLLLVVLVVGFIVSMGCFFVIDEGERGVLLRNGKFVTVADAGLSFKLPFFDSVKRISTHTHSVVYDGLTAYSKDQQPAIIRVSVTFKVPTGNEDVRLVYANFGTLEELIKRTVERVVPTQVENTFGQFTAISAVQERIRFGKELTTALKGSISAPILIESVQIENIDFSKAYEKSVEDRMRAEVEVQTQKQTLDKEKISAEIAVTQAQGMADSALAKATADAKAIKLRGESEAYAIEVKAKALAQNNNLIELIRSENWDGKLPTTMIPNGTLPFMDVGKK